MIHASLELNGYCEVVSRLTIQAFAPVKRLESRGPIKSILRFAVLTLALNVQVPAYAQDGLEYLVGKWTATTGANIGAPFSFVKAFIGYDALIPWWGQTTIIASNGSYGSHLKIAGKYDGANAECFYYVQKISTKKMAWNLRHADVGHCPESVVFERVDSIGEKADSQVEEPSAGVINAVISRRFLSNFTFGGPFKNPGSANVKRERVSNSMLAGDFLSVTYSMRGNSAIILTAFLDESQKTQALRIMDENKDDAKNGVVKQLYTSIRKEWGDDSAPLFVSSSRKVGSGQCYQKVTTISDGAIKKGKIKYSVNTIQIASETELGLMRIPWVGEVL
jgi:hypothetical protein